MKKILVVLLVLAVAGGVFAQQGDWSLGGDLEIGTRLNFDPSPGDGNTNNDDATWRGIPYHAWDGVRGKLSLGYTRDSLKVGFNWNTRAETEAYAEFSGDNFKGVIMVNNFSTLITSSYGGDGTVKRLWGEYSLVDGIVTLHVAAKGPDTEYWTSDKSVLSGFSPTKDGKNIVEGSTGYDGYGFPIAHHNFFGDSNTLTKIDGDTFFRAALTLESLEIGLFIPGLMFGNPSTPDNKLVDTSLLNTIIALKFNMSPIEVAAQFKIEDYYIYFGGKFFAGPVTFGLSFAGLLDIRASDDTYLGRTIGIGANVDYNADVFGAAIKVFMNRYVGVSSDLYDQVLGVVPGFFYNAIPDHLGFKLTGGFYFISEVNGSEKASEMDWAIRPELFWNFKGTGASSSYSWGGTQFIARFTVASGAADLSLWDPANVLDLIFKWGF
jgi:hypothetical protein